MLEITMVLDFYPKPRGVAMEELIQNLTNLKIELSTLNAVEIGRAHV